MSRREIVVCSRNLPSDRLFRAGVWETSVFAELDGISRDISDYYRVLPEDAAGRAASLSLVCS